MGLKPIPYEKASTTKVSPHKKLNKKVRKTHTKKSASTSDQLLKKTCSKILSYLETQKGKSIEKISELELLMHRSILALQKEKRSKATKKKPR